MGKTPFARSLETSLEVARNLAKNMSSPPILASPAGPDMMSLWRSTRLSSVMLHLRKKELRVVVPPTNSWKVEHWNLQSRVLLWSMQRKHQNATRKLLSYPAANLPIHCTYIEKLPYNRSLWTNHPFNHLC